MEAYASAKPIMFFDGGCPLCAREVDHYRRVDRGQRVEWIDLRQDEEWLPAFGVSRDEAMRRLHVLSGDGRLLTGAYAFAAIWEQLPGYRYLATLVRLPGILPLLDRVYERFAIWRYRRRCTDETCAV